VKHIVPHKHEGMTRLKEYVTDIFPSLPTKSAIKKAIRKGRLTVNNIHVTSVHLVVAGDEIELHPKVENPIKPSVIIPIVYEDEYLAVVHKPGGLLSSGNAKSTLANYLPSLLMESSETDALEKPLLVHRLDRATEGLIIAAKTSSVRVKFGKMLEAGEVSKVYAAIVQGHLSHDIKVIDEQIDEKNAITHITSIKHLETKDPTSLLSINLLTGRTHQIRKHMLSIGHPIVGDPIYNEGGLTFGRGLFLVAVELSFDHPKQDRRVELSIELPKKYQKYL